MSTTPTLDLFQHFNHFNAGEMRRASEALAEHLNSGGKLVITLAGAMSTARIGRVLAPAIEQGLVHCIVCTGANLEEDVFNALRGHEYHTIRDWRNIDADDELALLQRGFNRVTDVAIPEDVMKEVFALLLESWQEGPSAVGMGRTPADHMARVLSKLFARMGVEPPRWGESWVKAAVEYEVPIFVPGWSDSTTGNMFTAAVRTGKLDGYDSVCSDPEQLAMFAGLYEGAAHRGESVGFLQVGGGIAGDWPICVVPMLRQDEGNPVPHWSYFCQIGDAPASYGGYSGAPPNEKITWDKLNGDTPRFAIQSDATIVLPLMLSYLMEACR